MGRVFPTRSVNAIIIGSVVLLLWPYGVGAQDTSRIELPSIIAEIDTALSYIKLTGSDLALRTDYTDLDSFRLEIVNRVMARPTEMAVILEAAADSLFPPEQHGGNGRVTGCRDVITEAFGIKGFLYRSDRRMPEDPEDFIAQYAVQREDRRHIRDYLTTHRLIVHPLSSYINWLDDCQPAQYILTGWSKMDSLFLVDTLRQMLLEDPEAEFYPAEKIDSLQKASEDMAERFTELSDRINWRRHVIHLLNAEQVFFLALQRLKRELADYAPDSVMFDKIEFDTPSGRIALGGTGNDQYSGKYFFIYDPAGDDIYELDPMQPGECQAIFDLAGNDLYAAPEGYAIGAGFFGAGLLYDREGDDTYRAGSFSLGSGFFGAGALIDLDGNDVYISDCFSQGAGAFGYGYIYDHSGADQYSAAMYSQGFGFTAGVGLLADREDNDTYFAGGKYKDILRYDDHYLSLSQGFSYGIRPYFSGGVGWLMDGGGNDIYNADIFAQGCSYWWAFGALYDGGGNDSYNCFQYGQGAATHMASGILYDRAGGDVYFGKGLMQGVGHDRSTGWILDLAGNDTYTAWDLSQGAGSANGTGMLIDASGDDRYYVKNPANTQAYGNPRRDFGSIGVFLDLQGVDRYDGNGQDDDVWIINSKWGIGVDKHSVLPEDEK